MKDSGDEREAEDEDLTFEEYAAALAHLGHYRQEPDVILAQLAVESAPWQRAQARWPREMTRAVLEDDPSYAARFSAAFLPVKRRLLASKPALESIPPLRAPAVGGATPVLPEPPAPVIAAVAAPVTAPVVASSEVPAMQAPPAPPAIAPPLFMAVPPGMRHIKDLKGTSVAAEAPSGPALPFARAMGDRLPAAATPTSTSQQSVVPEGMRHFTSLTGTAMGPQAPAGPSLPFKGGLPERPPAINTAPPPVRPADLPELSIEQYASLNAELEFNPQRTGEILARYRMNEGQRARFDAFWQSRLASPDARRAYEQAHATYKTWLAQSARR